MGFMDELKKIIHPYDDEDYDYEDDFEEPVKESRSPFEDRKEDRRTEERRNEDRHNKVVNIHATTQLKVVLVKPERFENASEIADHRLPLGRSLCRRGQDQEGGGQHLYYHAVLRGYHG